jgi:glycosyltransferase involved in cell wall biosynthesis
MTETEQQSIHKGVPSVMIITPGGLEHGGGIGRMIGYMLDAWRNRPDAPKMRVIDSRGPGHIAFSPFHFAKCLLTIVLNVKRRPLLHIHVAGRGSTIRKIVIVHLASLLRFRMVLHLHDYNYRKSFQRFPKLIHPAIRSMFLLSQKVVVLGRGDRDLMVNVFGVKPDRTIIIGNAVPNPAQLPSMKSPGGAPHVVFLGNPSRRKGVHDLINAFSIEPLRSLQWRVTIAGGGGEVELFRAQTDRAALGERVAFPGWLSRDETAKLLGSADILVLPSYDEGMAMSVLEGMSYGLCVVCTPVGSLIDVIENGVSGIVVQPGNVEELAEALSRAITDPTLRGRLGRGAAALFARKYDASSYPDRMGAVYESAVS